MRVSNKISTMILGDILLALIAIYAGSGLIFFTEPSERLWTDPFVQLPVFVVTVLFASFLVEQYNYDKAMHAAECAARVAISMILSFIILSVLSFVLPAAMIGPGSFAAILATFGICQFLWHVLFTAFLNLNGFARKVLVVGTGEVAHQIGGVIRAANHQHVLRGYFECGEPASVPTGDIVGKGNALIQVVNREKPQKIVISLTERRGVLPVKEILSCKLSGIEIVDAASFYEEMTGKLLLEDLRPSALIFSDGFKTTPAIRLYKRLFDIVSALLFLLLTLPVLPLIALAIKVDSPGPVIFKQRRVGERESPFLLMKFRTMRLDAEKETGPVWAQKNDVRVTRVGRILRISRLDELPQFLNVLKGDMSLIGPRPERIEFVEKLKEIIPYYSERHFVKPGITGWAQIKYPYGASVSDAIEKLKFDLFYIKNMSPLLDLLIVLETIKVVLFGRGGR
jgi:sugar transferase (PEP-CTERM system associated)